MITYRVEYEAAFAGGSITRTVCENEAYATCCAAAQRASAEKGTVFVVATETRWPSGSAPTYSNDIGHICYANGRRHAMEGRIK